jgi:hypothetical protein
MQVFYKRKRRQRMKRIIATVGAMLIISGIASANDLKTYKATYEKEIDSIVLAHGMEMSQLGQSYTKALHSLLMIVKKAGHLDRSTATMDEIRRFSDERAMPSKASSFRDIQNLQTLYVKQASVLHATKAQKIISLTSKYDQALERLQKNLVSSDRFDDARAVQAESRTVKESDMTRSAKAFINECANKEVARPPAETASSTRKTSKFSSGKDLSLRGGPTISATVHVSLPDNVKHIGKVLTLREPARISNNRRYSMTRIPKKLKGMKYIQIPHKVRAPYSVTVNSSGSLWLLVNASESIQEYLDEGWIQTKLEVKVNHRDQKLLVLHLQTLTGDSLEIPGRKWYSPVVVAAKLTMD